jgi:hypothetical protein
MTNELNGIWKEGVTAWSTYYPSWGKLRETSVRAASVPAEIQIQNLPNTYKYCVSVHYPSSCFYLKTQRFGDWILSPSAGQTYSVRSSLRNFVCLIKKKQVGVLDKKTGRWVVSRNTIFVWMYHRYKLLDLTLEHTFRALPLHQTVRCFET